MTIFSELAVIIVIAATTAIIAHRLRQPLLVGYIAAGIIVGPAVINIAHSVETLEIFSTIGVSILLFIVGLALNPDVIRDVGRASLITGVGQVIFTSAVGFLLLMVLGFSPVHALYGAVALTFSSTIIVLKLLGDRGETGTLYGKLSIGFLLVQDIIATIILLVVSVVGTVTAGAGLHGTDLLAAVGEQAGMLLLKGCAIAIALYVVSKYILPRLARAVAQNVEVLFIFSIAWGLGLAALFASIGFSVEIGALIAGALLAVSPFAREIAARLTPLRDFFIVIFFILLGSHMALDTIGDVLAPALALSLFVLLGNPLIVIILMRRMGYSMRTAFMSGLTVAQISEFSLILIALGMNVGHVDQTLAALITLVGIITITASTYMFRFADTLYAYCGTFLKRVIPARSVVAREVSRDTYDAVIVGYDDAGHAFLQAARTVAKRVVVVDNDPLVIDSLRSRGIAAVYGDAEDVALLEEIGIADARLVIITVPVLSTGHFVTEYYRARRRDGVVIATAASEGDLRTLYAAGASYVLRPQHISAHFLAQALRDAQSRDVAAVVASLRASHHGGHEACAHDILRGKESD